MSSPLEVYKFIDSNKGYLVVNSPPNTFKKDREGRIPVQEVIIEQTNTEPIKYIITYDNLKHGTKFVLQTELKTMIKLDSNTVELDSESILLDGDGDGGRKRKRTKRTKNKRRRITRRKNKLKKNKRRRITRRR